jgi:hypothetical protein
MHPSGPTRAPSSSRCFPSSRSEEGNPLTRMGARETPSSSTPRDPHGPRLVWGPRPNALMNAAAGVSPERNFVFVCGGRELVPGFLMKQCYDIHCMFCYLQIVYIYIIGPRGSTLSGPVKGPASKRAIRAPHSKRAPPLQPVHGGAPIRFSGFPSSLREEGAHPL